MNTQINQTWSLHIAFWYWNITPQSFYLRGTVQLTMCQLKVKKYFKREVYIPCKVNRINAKKNRIEKESALVHTHKKNHSLEWECIW
jgi:hypothetical protein